MRKMTIKIPTVRLARELLKLMYFSTITFVLQWIPGNSNSEGKSKTVRVSEVD